VLLTWTCKALGHSVGPIALLSTTAMPDEGETIRCGDSIVSTRPSPQPSRRRNGAAKQPNCGVVEIFWALVTPAAPCGMKPRHFATWRTCRAGIFQLFRRKLWEGTARAMRGHGEGSSRSCIVHRCSCTSHLVLTVGLNLASMPGNDDIVRHPADGAFKWSERAPPAHAFLADQNPGLK
jgi:hypothetical protein